MLETSVRGSLALWHPGGLSGPGAVFSGVLFLEKPNLEIWWLGRPVGCLEPSRITPVYSCLGRSLNWIRIGPTGSSKLSGGAFSFSLFKRRNACLSAWLICTWYLLMGVAESGSPRGGPILRRGRIKNLNLKRLKVPNLKGMKG